MTKQTDKKDEKQQKADRLSQALRDNLFKRKAQARKRANAPSQPQTTPMGTDDKASR